MHLLDLAGPGAGVLHRDDLGLDYELHYVAEQPEVPTAQGLPLRAATGLAGAGRRRPRGRAGLAVADAARRRSRSAGARSTGCAAHHAAGGTVASVCAGADALGRAGLLDGRRCTTHHDVQDELARRYPAATVVRDVLYVVDGRVVTSAGIASGIDLALHLVAIRHGPAAAARVARAMVVYARRNGDEQQASAMLRHRAHLNDAVHRVQDLIDARFAEPLPLADLARPAGSANAR